MSELVKAKQQLRSQCQRARQEMPRSLRLSETQNVNQSLFDEFLKRECTAVASYVAKGDELDLKEFHEMLWKQDIDTYFPVVTGSTELKWGQAASYACLVKASFGLLEPQQPHRHFSQLPYHMMVIVPGLGFSREGARIGWGRGYYDRQIPYMIEQQAALVGVGFSTQLVEKVPTEDHDQQLPQLLIGGEWYRCE